MKMDWLKRVSIFGSIVLGAAVFSTSNRIEAGWPEFKQSCHVDRLRNNAWPQPFRAMDTNSAMAPFEVMKANGWRENNTLASTFFDTSHQLSEAGELKLSQVLLHSPANLKQVYVAKGATPEQTSARIESVQIAISEKIPTGALPEILVTDIEPTVSSGQYQTVVTRALLRTIPSPRLPKATDKVSAAPAQLQVAPNASTPNGK